MYFVKGELRKKNNFSEFRVFDAAAKAVEAEGKPVANLL